MSFQLDDRRMRLVRLGGLKPPTLTFAESRSFQLSYSRIIGGPRRFRTADIRCVKTALCLLSYRAI